MGRWRLRLAARLSLWIIGGTALVFIAVLSVLAERYHRLALEETARAADLLTRSLHQRLTDPLYWMEQQVASLANLLGREHTPTATLVELFDDMRRRQPDVWSLAVIVPDALGRPLHAPFVTRRDEVVITGDLTQPDYALSRQEWYQSAHFLRSPLWSEPNQDNAGRWFTTYVYPVLDTDGSVLRMLASDMSLDWLGPTIEAIWPEQANGRALVLSASGMVLYPPPPPGERAQSVYLLAEQEPQLAAVARLSAMHHRSLAMNDSRWMDNPGGWVATAPLERSGWTLALVYPENPLLRRVRAQLVYAVWAGAGGLILMAVLVLALSRRITRPLTTLVEAVNQMATGDLDAPLPESVGHDEVAGLTRAFTHMRGSLKTHIADLERTTADKQRLESELTIARQIQMSMVPTARAEDPLGHYTIRAHLAPARFIGGDLYDYFPVGDHRLGFLVGDVADKGVPAALFMARTASLMRVLAPSAAGPAATLTAVNRTLSEDNDSFLFVTVFYAVLNLRTGDLRYAAAGHDPAIVLAPDGDAAPLPGEGSPPLGLDPDTAFIEHRFHLKPGFRLLGYSDGVTEATDLDLRLFGEAALHRTLYALGAACADDTVEAVVNAVTRHAGPAPAADDLTLICMHYEPAAQTAAQRWMATIHPGPGEPAVTLDALHDWLTARSVSAQLAHDLHLVAEEWVVNLHVHGCADQPGVEISVAVESERIVLHAVDQGAPFDPRTTQAPPLDMDVEERPVGGLGLYLIQTLADELDYQSGPAGNRLTVIKACTGTTT